MHKGTLAATLGLSAIVLLAASQPAFAQLYAQHNLISDDAQPADLVDPSSETLNEKIPDILPIGSAADISITAAVTVFPGKIYRAPQSWAERSYHNLIYFHGVNRGGHFAAWEHPELLATEIRAAFRSMREYSPANHRTKEIQQ